MQGEESAKANEQYLLEKTGRQPLQYEARHTFQGFNGGTERATMGNEWPIAVAGHVGRLRTGVVTGQAAKAPWLVSSNTLTRMGAVIDTENSTMIATKINPSQIINLIKTPSGHFLMPMFEFTGTETEALKDMNPTAGQDSVFVTTQVTVDNNHKMADHMRCIMKATRSTPWADMLSHGWRVHQFNTGPQYEILEAQLGYKPKVYRTPRRDMTDVTHRLTVAMTNGKATIGKWLPTEGGRPPKLDTEFKAPVDITLTLFARHRECHDCGRAHPEGARDLAGWMCQPCAVAGARTDPVLAAEQDPEQTQYFPSVLCQGICGMEKNGAPCDAPCNLMSGHKCHHLCSQHGPQETVRAMGSDHEREAQQSDDDSDDDYEDEVDLKMLTEEHVEKILKTFTIDEQLRQEPPGSRDKEITKEELAAWLGIQAPMMKEKRVELIEVFTSAKAPLSEQVEKAGGRTIRIGTSW